MEAIITPELTTSTTLILCPPSHCTLPVGLKQLVIFSHVLSRRRWDYFYFCATSVTYMEWLGALKVPSHYHHHHHHHHHPHRRRRRRRDFFSSHPYFSSPPFGLKLSIRSLFSKVVSVSRKCLVLHTPQAFVPHGPRHDGVSSSKKRRSGCLTKETPTLGGTG